MTKCFISHASTDRSFVKREIVDSLEDIGFDVWFAEEDIQSANDWRKSIQSGLNSSDWVIIVMSQNSASSQWVKKEAAWAMKERPGRVLPILLSDCKLDDIHVRLPSIQYIDFRKQRKQAGRRLVRLLIDSEYNPFRRARAVNGKWKGVVKQYPGVLFPGGMEYPINADFTIENDNIGGHFMIDLPLTDETRRIEFEVRGGFHHGTFVQFNYSARDIGAIQFGSVVTRLSADGRRMCGKFVGYGAVSEEIVSGSVELAKT
jgi:hypothetical protein